MTPLHIVIMVIVALGAGAVGFFVAAAAGRRGERTGASRRLLKALVHRRVLKGKAGFVRLFPGGYVHLVPRGRDIERAMRPGDALAAREAHGGPLVRFSLEDLLDADHPAADAFGPAVGLPDGALSPERILFTAVPDLVRRQAAAAIAAEGMQILVEGAFTPSSDDPFGVLSVTSGPYRHDLAVADMVAESVGTVTPLAVVAGDRAHRARAELELYEAFHRAVEARFPDAVVAIDGPWLSLSIPGRDPRRLDYRRLATRVPGGREGWAAYLERLGDDDGIPEIGRTPDDPPAPVDLTPWIARRFKPLSFLDDPRHEKHIAIDRGGYAEVFTAETAISSRYLEPDGPLARDRTLDEVSALADAALDRTRFSGHVILTGGGEGELESLTIVAPNAASIAQHPDLLAGAAHSVGRFAPGARVRVRVDREAVLVIAAPSATEAFLVGCRRAASRLAEAADLAIGEPVHLDVTLSLGEHPVGRFALMPLDEGFFRAALEERAARAIGDHAAAAEARGLMRLSLGDPEGARVHLAEAARLSPADAELHLALGTLLNDVGDHEGAARELARAVKLDGDSAAVSNNLGVAYQGLGRYDEAVLCFEKALELSAGDPLIRVNLGRVRFDLGDRRGAERAFEEALEQDPKCLPALTGLVLVALREGNIDLARRRLVEAMRVDPADEALLRLHRALHPDELLQ